VKTTRADLRLEERNSCFYGPDGAKTTRAQPIFSHLKAGLKAMRTNLKNFLEADSPSDGLGRAKEPWVEQMQERFLVLR